MGKAKEHKPPAKAKAKAKAEDKVAEPAEDEAAIAERAEARRIYEQRRDAKKWVQAELDMVRTLLAAATKRGNCDWLQVAHEFHEVQLIRLLKRLEDKELSAVPAELKEGVEAYVSQFAANADIQQDGLNSFREVWDLLAGGGPAFARGPESPEAAIAIEQLKCWTTTNMEGIQKFSDLMQIHLSSPGAQEAGLIRIGGLLGKAREGYEAGDGLTAGGLMPAVKDAMGKHLADPEVQRSGCAALRGLAMAKGQLPPLCDAGGVELAVEGLKAHFKCAEVAGTANGTFWAMAQAAGKNSPEHSRLRTAGVTEVLLKVMTHHAWNQALCGRVRTTLPFLTED